MNVIHVDGSHGILLVHTATGHVIEKVKGCDCDECDGGYDDVAMFDINDLRREAHLGDHLDIIYIGYWDRAGCYEPATTNRTEHHPRYGWVFDKSVAMEMLPAPQALMAA